MAGPARSRAPRAVSNDGDPLAASPASPVDGLVQLQRLQWGALIAWQQSFVAFNQDLWDQWASRYAGGVPIDR